ncbi:MAG: hypothetical protein ACOCXQ_04420 [Patescibacteria group bacterium]
MDLNPDAFIPSIEMYVNDGFLHQEEAKVLVRSLVLEHPYIIYRNRDKLACLGDDFSKEMVKQAERALIVSFIKPYDDLNDQVEKNWSERKGKNGYRVAVPREEDIAVLSRNGVRTIEDGGIYYMESMSYYRYRYLVTEDRDIDASTMPCVSGIKGVDDRELTQTIMLHLQERCVDRPFKLIPGFWQDNKVILDYLEQGGRYLTREMFLLGTELEDYHSMVRHSLNLINRNISTAVRMPELVMEIKSRLSNDPHNIEQIMRYTYQHHPRLFPTFCSSFNVPKGQFRDEVLALLKSNVLSDLENLEPLFWAGNITKDEQESFFREYAERYPALYLYEVVNASQEPWNVPPIVTDAMLSDLDCLEEILRNWLEPEYTELIRVNNLNRNDLQRRACEIVRAQVDQGEETNLRYQSYMRLGFTPQEIHDIILKQVANGKQTIMSSLYGVSDAILRIFTQREIEYVIRQSSKTALGQIICAQNSDIWVNRCSQKFIEEWVMDTLIKNPKSLLATMTDNDFLSVLNSSGITQKQYQEMCLTANPAMILRLQYEPGALCEFDKEVQQFICQPRDIRTALGQQCMPKAIAAYESSVQKGNVLAQRLELLRDLEDMYAAAQRITNASLTEVYDQVFQSLPKRSAEEERLVLETLSAYIQLAEMIDVCPVATNINTYPDLERAISQILVQVLEIEELETLGDENSLQESLGFMTPFVSYVIQYGRQKDYKPVLADIYNHVCLGTYREYKYGTESDFERMKADGYIPRELTYSQYQVWQKDDISGDEPLREVSAQIADSIHVLTKSNAELLDLKIPTDNQQKAKVLLDCLREERAAFGTKRQAVKRTSEDHGFLTAKMTDVEKHLKREQFFFNLLYGERDNLQTVIENRRMLTQWVTDLRSYLPPDNTYLTYLFNSYIMQISATKVEAGTTCVDKGDIASTLYVGEKPVQTCMHWRDGDYNAALLGYTEANTKIFWVLNKRQRPIGRAVVRLLEDQGGAPVLQVEKTYPEDGDPQIEQMILEAVNAKARKMGVSQVTVNINYSPPQDYQITGEELTLACRNKRAPSINSDAGIEFQGSGYIITNQSPLVCSS